VKPILHRHSTLLAVVVVVHLILGVVVEVLVVAMALVVVVVDPVLVLFVSLLQSQVPTWILKPT
jgi:hypothetical protein